MLTTHASLLGKLGKPEAADAWGRFVELYSPLLFHWAKHLGLQDSDAADLVQDVFLRLLRKLPEFQYDPQRSFHCWLKTLFLNQHNECLRLRKALPVGDHTELPSPDPIDEFEDRRFLTQQALRLIEPEFSPVLWKAFQEYALAGRSADEIAGELGISRGTVYSVKSKVILRLRREFEQLVD
jgi:RNA polymerase sigma-70 factor (ECF subfamily)